MQKNIAILVIVTLCGLATRGAVFAQNRNWGPNDLFVPGELLVQFKPGRSQAAIAAVNVQHRASTIRILRRIGVHHLKTAMPVLDAVRSYQNHPDVEYAEPNYIMHPSIDSQRIPNDPRYPELWGLNNTGQTGGKPDADIDAPEAWDIQTGRASVVVAVIDTGRFDHVDLVRNRWTNPGEIPDNGVDDDGNGFIDDVHGWNFFGDNNSLFGSDDCDDAHGTHTAGTIGARRNNDIGVVGVNWQVSIMTLKFLGGSSCRGTTADAIEALMYAADNGAHLSSNSWGGGGFSQALQDAIEATGMPFVAAAGNSDNDNEINPFYPCSYTSDEVICVASTTHTDAKSGFSNFGATSVDLGAPGSSILSTTPFDNYSFFSGTSMATPHVAGVAALLYAQFPGITMPEVKCRLLQNVDPLPALAGITVTGGRLNASKALMNSCIEATVSGDISVDGAPVVGRRVRLENVVTKVTETTTTDANGHYEFTTVANGTYKITIKSVTVSSTAAVLGNVQVNSSPEVGKTVRLRSTGLTDTTDANGDFAFAGVAPGSYTIIIKKVDLP